MSPSVISVAKVALAFLPLALAGTPKACPITASSPVSCQSSGTAASCCFESPGGQLLQTQFWDTDPATGPTTSWTIHGLWYVLSLSYGSSRHRS